MIELEFISGENKGKSFRPYSERFGIGRSPDNALSIRNQHISTHHGRIEKKNGEYIYHDLNSTNGTLVQRNKEQFHLCSGTSLEITLQDSDELVLGSHTDFVVLKLNITQEEMPAENGHRTIIATRALKDLPDIDNMLKQDHETLMSLYAYTKEMQGINDSNQLLKCLCRFIFEIFPPASHIAVIRRVPEIKEYRPVYYEDRTKPSGTEESFALSRSIINRVIEKQEALLFQDAAKDFNGAESILAGKILSSICVPLWNQEGILGLLQVDNRQTDVMFQTEDLEVLTIIGNHTATLMGNIELFEELKATLNRLELMELAKCHMSKFVPSSVQKVIDEDPKGLKPEKVEKCVTVLFLDICGYTKMSEVMEYKEVSHIVEHYFSRFLDLIYSHNGDINETAGDGLMVIFQGEQHVRDAVLTAVQIQKKTMEVNLERAGEHSPIYINIGINTGTASVGLVCFEGMAGARWTYTASGSITNLAARMAAYAVTGQTIISKDVADQIGNDFPLENLGPVTLKNVSMPIRLYSIVQ